MQISLIITTYNWPESLNLVLKSVETQTIPPKEVVIADDGSTDETKNTIKKFRQDSNLNIIHSWQEDKGFRVAKSRNKAIAKSNGEYIVLIDGDTILHPKFIEDHMKNAKYGCFIQGTRVLLNKNTKNQIMSNNQFIFPIFANGLQAIKHSIHSNLLSKIFSTKSSSLKGIKSCNLSFFKQDCINVMGLIMNLKDGEERIVSLLFAF